MDLIRPARTFLLIVLLTFIRFLTFSQNGHTFILNGHIDGSDVKSVTLWYHDINGKLSKAVSQVIGGKFSFSGNIDQPAAASLRCNLSSEMRSDSNYVSLFFIEPAPMHVDVKQNYVKRLKLCGSGTQKQFETLEKSKSLFYRQAAPFKLRLAKLNDTLGNALKNKDSVKIKDIMIKRKAIFTELEPYSKKAKKLDLNYVYDHPDSYLSSYLLNRLFSVFHLGADTVKYYLSRLTPRIQNSYLAKEIRWRLHPDRILPIGAEFPEIDGLNMKRLEVSSKEFLANHNYTLIILWASWCPPCRHQMPTYKELFNRYNKKGLNFIAITEDWDFNDWLRAIKSDKTKSWQHIFPDNSKKMSNQLGLSSIPAEILLRHGKVVAKYGGADDKFKDLQSLKEKLEKIYNER